MLLADSELTGTARKRHGMGGIRVRVRVRVVSVRVSRAVDDFYDAYRRIRATALRLYLRGPITWKLNGLYAPIST